MIKNEKQYKISKAQLQILQNAIDAVPDWAENVQPALLLAQKEAIQSQYNEVLEFVKSYEQLKNGAFQHISIQSFSDLPIGLIQARIAKGLSQKELGERLGLKEQQIQRYEATNYATASFERLKQIISALDIKVTKDIFLSEEHYDEITLFKNFAKFGISKDFILKRILPNDLVYQIERLGQLGNQEAKNLIGKIGSILAKVFHVSEVDVFNNNLQLTLQSGSLPRYKKASNANMSKVTAYTIYAHMVALNVLQSLKQPLQIRIPDDPEVVRTEILNNYGSVNFESVIDYLWSLGIPVIALNDASAFHGACWRINGQNVIVLKQSLMSEARWLFDAIHEFCHAGQHPEIVSLDIIEGGDFSHEMSTEEDEVEANYFAAEVILGSDADKMANECITLAKGRVENLKGSVPTIARKYNVDLGALASHLSFRLANEKKINWWGTANNLQKADFSPWHICRTYILKYCDLSKLNDFDRELIVKAIM